MPLEFEDIFGAAVELTPERLKHIVDRHPAMLDASRSIPLALASPDLVLFPEGEIDQRIYYRRHQFRHIGEQWLAVVVIEREYRKFIVTAYATDFIKRGDVHYAKDNSVL